MIDGEKFECRVCKGGVTKQDSADMRLRHDTAVERIEMFCYLDDMLSSDGGCGYAVISQMNGLVINSEN